MKKFAIIAAICSAPGVMFADGPGTPGTFDPPVIVPYGAGVSQFAGAYAGIAFSRHTATSERVDEYTPETEIAVTDKCVFTGGHSNGSKCDGVPASVVAEQFGELRSCGKNYNSNCIVNRNQDGTVRVFVKGAANGDLIQWETGETFTEYGDTVFTSITEQFTGEEAGVFAGYRFAIAGDVLTGVELFTDEMLSTAELSIGYDLGAVFGYGFAGVGRYDDIDGFVYGAGADLALGHDWFTGVKATIGEFDDLETETVALRVFRKF